MILRLIYFEGAFFLLIPATPFCHIASLQSLNPYCVILHEFHLRAGATYQAAQSVVIFYTVNFLFLCLSPLAFFILLERKMTATQAVCLEVPRNGRDQGAETL